MPAKQCHICLRIVWLLVLCSLAGIVPAAGETSRPMLKAAVLRDFPPQYSTSPAGQPEGFAVDVIHAIADLADVDIVFVVKDTWDQVFDAVRSGEADLIPNQGITEQRREWFAFTAPVETFPVRIFVRATSKGIHSATDLAGRKVGVMHLNVGESLLIGKPDIHPQVYQHIKDAFFDLISGSLDAIVFPEPVLRLMARRAGLEDRIMTVGPPLAEIKRAISVRRDNAILLKRLNAVVEKFIGSPAYEKIYARWYGTPPPLITVRQLATLMGLVIVVLVIAMTFWRYHSLVRVNLDLTRSIQERQRAERALRESHDQLETRVRERTAALSQSNRELTDEIERRKELEKERERLIADLKEALVEVRTLSGLLPICSSCKKIRDDKGYWNQIESFISAHSEAEFSHGICPECARRLYPGLDLET